MIDLDSSASGTAAGGTQFKASYENYLLLLLLLTVDDQTLLQRTSDLITLNVNQAKAETDTTITSLDNFKMSEAYTAVKGTCKVKSDFVIVPDYMAQQFLAGSSAESTIQRLENQFFGYSVIRGY